MANIPSDDELLLWREIKRQSQTEAGGYFDPAAVQRAQLNDRCGWMECVYPPHEVDYRDDDGGWVLAKDYDALLGLYNMTCELLRIEQSCSDNPPKS
jgi:hypothetical protein